LANSPGIFQISAPPNVSALASQSIPSTRARQKAPRRLAIIAGLVLIAAWLVFKPPFVVRPLPGQRANDSATAPTQTAAARFVEPIWTSKILPTIQEKAHQIASILPEIRSDPEAAGQKYGRREATNPYNYMIKGTGKVTEVHTESQAGTATLEIPDLAEKVILQIGPVLRGTALRDATGIVSFNQFTNQLDYADVSKEINSRALKTAFPGAFDPTSLSGKTITFFGAFTFDPRSKSPVLITPVKVDL
jgi:predicted lipoprotein